MLDAMTCHAVLFHSDFELVTVCAPSTRSSRAVSDATTTVQHHHEHCWFARYLLLLP